MKLINLRFRYKTFAMLMLSLSTACSQEGMVEDVIPEYKQQLLDTAFASVSKMPLDPHVRNRSRAQYKLVETSLELLQPQLAEKYANGIADWRRAASYADIAHFYGKNGKGNEAVPYIEKAERLLELSEEMKEGNLFPTGDSKVVLESMQEWRLDRVKAHLAKAYIALGNADRSIYWSAGINENETPGVTVYETTHSTTQPFDLKFKSLTELAKTENFEAVKNALLGFVELYGQGYENETSRSQIRGAVDAFRAAMPRFMQIEILLGLAQAAYDHDDLKNCNTIVHEADALLEGAKYFPRMYYPMKSHIISLLFLTGEKDSAAHQYKIICDRYGSDREKITDIYRVGILCRIAEACSVVNGTKSAVEMYAKALTEGLVNPNSRPRADDLNEICCSMATSDVKPTDLIFQQVEEFKNNLGDPW